MTCILCPLGPFLLARSHISLMLSTAPFVILDIMNFVTQANRSLQPQIDFLSCPYVALLASIYLTINSLHHYGLPFSLQLMKDIGFFMYNNLKFHQQYNNCKPNHEGNPFKLSSYIAI